MTAPGALQQQAGDQDPDTDESQAQPDATPESSAAPTGDGINMGALDSIISAQEPLAQAIQAAQQQLDAEQNAASEQASQMEKKGEPQQSEDNPLQDAVDAVTSDGGDDSKSTQKPDKSTQDQEDGGDSGSATTDDDQTKEDLPPQSPVGQPPVEVDPQAVASPPDSQSDNPMTPEQTFAQDNPGPPPTDNSTVVQTGTAPAETSSAPLPSPENIAALGTLPADSVGFGEGTSPQNPTPVSPSGASIPSIPSTETTPTPTVPTGTILKGNGNYPGKVTVQGADVVVHNVPATVQGGAGDAKDNGTAPDPNNPNGPEVPLEKLVPSGLWVSLPTGQNSATYGSPLPPIPFGTKVAVTDNKTGKTLIGTYVGEGPVLGKYGDKTGAEDEDGNPTEQAGIDVGPGFHKAFGWNGDANTTDGGNVSFKIIGGAQYVTPQQVQGEADPNSFDPSDLSTIQKMGQAVYTSNGTPDFDALDDLVGQLKSGSLRTQFINTFGGIADARQNNINRLTGKADPSDDNYNLAPQRAQAAYNALHQAFIRQQVINSTRF